MRPVLALVLAMATASPAVAFVDDFESETLGDLNGQNNWFSSMSHTAGTFDVENTTVLNGAQSLSLSGVPGGITEYRHLVPASNYCTVTWQLQVTDAYSGVYACDGDDSTENWGVWVDMAGNVYVDDSVGVWSSGGTVTAGAVHSYRMVQSPAGTIDLYIDGSGTPSFSGSVMTIGTGAQDRLLLSFWSTGPDGSANQAIWDDVNYSVPPAITVVKTMTGGEGVGAPVQYQITVTNVGGNVITDLVVVDTIPSVLQNVTTTEPGGWGVPAVTSVSGGTRYEWSATGLTFNPTDTLTFTIDGAIGFVCAQTAISNTAYAAATSAAGWADLFSGVSGAVIEPPAATVSVVQTMTPGALVVGGPVQYQIVVTNTGSATLASVTVTDTVAPVVTAVTPTTPAGFAAPVVMQGASGTIYSWESTGPVYWAGPLTFQLDGTVGDVCVSTAVSNTGYAYVVDDCGTGEQWSNVAGAVVAPPAGAVTIVQSPVGSPVVGGPVTYQFQVTNTGTIPLSRVIVVDTVAPEVTGVVQSTPPGFAVLPVVQGASGTIYSWESTGPFAPSDSQTFTLAGTVGDVCASTAVSNTGYAYFEAPCAAGETASGVEGFAIVGPLFQIGVTNTQTAWTGVGAPVSYQIVITNTGAVNVDDLIIVDTVSPEVVGVTTTRPLGWAAPVVTSVAGGTRYEWAGTGLALAPAGTLTFTIDGAAGLVCASTGLSNTAYATSWTSCARSSAMPAAAGSIVEPPVTALTITNVESPASPAVGNPVTYQITVTNVGTATLDSVVVVDTVDVAIAGPVQTVTPAGFVTQPVVGRVLSWISTGPLPFGVPATFQIDGTVALVCATRDVGNTAFVAGTSGCATDPQSASAEVFTDPAGICSAATVEASIAVSPASPMLCENLIVDLTITNTGAADISGLGLEGGILRPEGPGLWLSGPTPPFSGTLLIGSSFTCSFVYGSTASGAVVLSVTVTGNDAGSGVPITGYLAATPSITIPGQSPFPASVAVSSFTAAKSQYVTGQTIDYTISLWNSGWDPAAGVEVSDTLPPGLAFVGCGGAPCVETGGLVVWSLTGTLPMSGTYDLTLSVQAPAANCAVPVTSDPCSLGGCVFVDWTNACGNLVWPWYSFGQAVPPAVVNASIVPTVVPQPPTAAEGAVVRYNVTLANTCSDTAINVVVWDTIPPGVALAALGPGATETGGLVRWTVASVSPGASVTVFFSVSVTSPGPLIDPTIASVTNANSTGQNQPLAVSAGAGVTVMGPLLSVVKTGPDAGSTDDFLPFLISVYNGGTDTALNLVVTDNLPSELLFVSGSPGPVVAGKAVSWSLPDLPPGGRTSVTVTTRGSGVENELVLVNQAVATCVNSGHVAMAPVTGTKTVSLTPRLKVRVFPTPFSPATAVGGTLKFSGLPDSATVRIYTVSGSLVRELTHVVHHRIVWDGRTDGGAAAAPGLYLYVIELPGGKTAKGNFGVVR
ncbi:MAG: hypothetical protein AAB152_13835 [Candidatus Coatesbacteria bacterium]